MTRFAPARAIGFRLGSALLITWLTSGCDLLAGPDDGPLEYVVERFEVVERTEEWAPYPIAHLRTDVAVVNVSDDPLTLSFGACALQLDAFADTPEEAEPVWRSPGRMTWPSSIQTFCAAYAVRAELEPGDTLRAGEFRADLPLAEILGDSLPAGTYIFQGRVPAPGGTARIDLGRLLLPESRHPLPDETMSRDGFHYRVDVEPGGSSAEGVATLEVTYNAPISQALERTFSRECPLRILAFPSARARETVPTPEPSWRWPASCGEGEQDLRLGPDETRTFEVPLPPDLPERTGAEGGRYFLMGVVEVDGRPIRMAVGKLELEP